MEVGALDAEEDRRAGDVPIEARQNLLAIAETFRYGFRQWAWLVASPDLFSVWLGFTAGLFGAMVSGIFDHPYFNIDFQGSVTMFWMFIGFSLAAARLAQVSGPEVLAQSI